MPRSDESEPVDLPGGEELPRLLLAALEQTRAPACITTAELDLPGPRIVYVNPAYCEMTGRERSEVVGATPRIMQGPMTNRAELDRLRSELASGRSFEGETVNYRADRTPFIINWRIDHVRDETGRTTHFVATQEDVTERRRTQRLLAAEQLIDDALTTTLTESFESGAAVRHVLDAIRRGAELIAPTANIRVSVRIEGDRYDVGTRAASVHGASAYRFGRSERDFEGDIFVTAIDDDHQAFLDGSGLARFASHSTTVLAALVEYGRQRRTAIRLQTDLLPGPLAPPPHLRVATEYLPGRSGVIIGGDWYDLSTGDDRAVVTIGDVSGSGVDAAVLMGRLRLIAELELARGASVEDLLTLLDEVCEFESAFATFLAIEFELPSMTGHVWSCGHPPPIVVGPVSTEVPVLRVSPPLGHMEGRVAAPTRLSLSAGETIVLYTDGVVERRNELIDAGIERLCDALAGSVGPEEAIEAAVAQAGQLTDDDIALIALQHRG